MQTEQEDSKMPRNSMDGSTFPALEQEGRSVSHKDRSAHKKIEKINAEQSENKRKDEKIEANES